MDAIDMDAPGSGQQRLTNPSVLTCVMDAPGIEPGASPVLEHNMPCEGCVLPMNYAPEYNMRIYPLARFKKLLIRTTDYSRLSRMQNEA